MELIKPGTKINFVGVKHIAIGVSLTLIVISLFGMLVWPGINWGIDFAGGATIQVSFNKPIDMNLLRKTIESLDLGEVMVQKSDLIGGEGGDNYLIKVAKLGIEDMEMYAPRKDTDESPPPAEEPPKTESGPTAPADPPAPGNTAGPDPAEGNTTAPISGETAAPMTGGTASPMAGNTSMPGEGNTAAPAPGSTASSAPGSTAETEAPEPETTADLVHEATPVQMKLDEVFGKESYNILSTDFVGPRVGKELRNRGFMAVALALVLLLVYVTLRFDFRFGVGAIVALFHDVTITMGFFVFTHREFNLAIIAALLSIIGYSLNDTIVVCDRIRDNIRRMKRASFAEMINVSVNETLSRTIMTSFTTFIVVFFLYLLGGGVINDFAFAMMVGIVVGTYSTIYIASPVVIYWEQYREAKRSPAAIEAAKK